MWAHKKKQQTISERIAYYDSLHGKKNTQPLQTVKAKKHSMSQFWENVGKTEQPELEEGPRIKLKETDGYEEEPYSSNQRHAGKLNRQWPDIENHHNDSHSSIASIDSTDHHSIDSMPLQMHGSQPLPDDDSKRTLSETHPNKQHVSNEEMADHAPDVSHHLQEQQAMEQREEEEEEEEDLEEYKLIDAEMAKIEDEQEMDNAPELDGEEEEVLSPHSADYVEIQKQDVVEPDTETVDEQQQLCMENEDEDQELVQHEHVKELSEEIVDYVPDIVDGNDEEEKVDAVAVRVDDVDSQMTQETVDEEDEQLIDYAPELDEHDVDQKSVEKRDELIIEEYVKRDEENGIADSEQQ